MVMFGIFAIKKVNLATFLIILPVMDQWNIRPSLLLMTCYFVFGMQNIYTNVQHKQEPYIHDSFAQALYSFLGLMSRRYQELSTLYF